MASNSSAHFKVLILGAGSGGIAMASRLSKALGPKEVAVLDASEHHYYQPLWTLVGAGVVKKEETEKSTSSLIPTGVEWLKEKVAKVIPTENRVICVSQKEYTYEFLVIATGLQLDYQKIKGVEGNLGKNGLCSIYRYQDAEITSQMLENFKGGQAIFTMPPVPIKCAGAPQKIMYLADEIFRRNGVREKSKIAYATAGKVIFGVPKFAEALLPVAAEKKIDLMFSHKLVEVKADQKMAVFEKSTESNGQTQTQLVEMPYDLLHVVPPMSAHSYVRESGLAFTEGAQAGWLKVNQYTLQHQDHKNIFGIGDVTGVPNSKTGAAIRKQAPIVTYNILQVMLGEAPTMQYDGYSSCPLIVGFGKVILAEFGYDNKLLPSFPMEMAKPRRSMWVLKKDLLPPMYWKGMMKGYL